MVESKRSEDITDGASLPRAWGLFPTEEGLPHSWCPPGKMIPIPANMRRAKKNPGKIKFGATLGSTSHFFPLDIANQAGIEFKIVGYEGTAKRQAALLGGFIDLGESNPAAGKKYFEAKKLKPFVKRF